MPDLPKKKVGIVACSGEEMAEGTVTRLAVKDWKAAAIVIVFNGPDSRFGHLAGG